MAVVTGDKLEVMLDDEQLLLNGKWRAFIESAAAPEDWRGYMDLEHDDERALSLPEAGTIEGIFHADDGKEYKGWFSVSIRLDSVGHHLKLQGLGAFHGTSPRPHY